MGAQHTSSIGRTVSPSTALKNVAPFACTLRADSETISGAAQVYLRRVHFKQLRASQVPLTCCEPQGNTRNNTTITAGLLP